MDSTVYTKLDISTLKKILDLIDDPDNLIIKGIIIKFGADWCGPCKNITPYCNSQFKLLKNIVCFDIDIDKDENMELYLAYKQKKMITSIPTIFGYVEKQNRDKTHWWVPDFSVNSSKLYDIENFIYKINMLTK